MIALIDYGMGNLHSVYNALQKIDCPCVITSDIQVIRSCSGIILPGVGAFKDCMQNLASKNLITCLQEEVAKQKPLLGICLGMQVLFETGYEGECTKGLGFLQGDIVRMQDLSVKIPHIGWNALEVVVEDVLVGKQKHPDFVYFVHSYFAQNYDYKDVVAYSKYGTLKIVAYVHKGNVMGMQYHPEKSGAIGLAMLNKFKEMCV